MSKERLVELIAVARNDYYDYSDEMHERGMSVDQSSQEYIADYLLANGVIVPTYNIGQTVYAVTKGDNLWWKGTVASICYEFNEMSYGISFDDGDFAMFEEECVFPTKEEAEAKLKESEGNGI